MIVSEHGLVQTWNLNLAPLFASRLCCQISIVKIKQLHWYFWGHFRKSTSIRTVIRLWIFFVCAQSRCTLVCAYLWSATSFSGSLFRCKTSQVTQPTMLYTLLGLHAGTFEASISFTHHSDLQLQHKFGIVRMSFQSTADEMKQCP